MNTIACHNCGHQYDSWTPPDLAAVTKAADDCVAEMLSATPAPLPDDDAKAVQIARLETLRDTQRAIRDSAAQRFANAADKVMEITAEILRVKLEG